MTAVLGVIPLPTAVLPKAGNVANLVVMTLLWVNVFWGLINLMPVFPLDGGNIARHLLLKADPWDGVRKSLWISAVTGAVLAVAGLLLLGSIYMALLFGFLAFQSYQSLQGRSGIGF
jgi:stage IV sporulation protein FB